MPHKKLKLGKATRRRVSGEEARLIKKSSAQQGRGQSASEARAIERKRDRSRGIRTAEKTIKLNKPKSAPKRLIEAIGKVVGKTKVIGKKDVQIPPLVKAGVAASVLPGIAGGAAAGGVATISRTASAIRGGRTVASLATQRAFAGRSTASGLDKVFHKVRPIAQRFGSNTKTKGLTTSLLSKAGLGLGTAGLLVGAIGSYPFAGFIKEEAIQTLGFAFNTAERNKDIEGMENALAEVEEILDNQGNIMDKVPYANVLKQLRVFFEAAEVKLDNDRRRLETLRGEQEAGETAFQRERRETDEAAFERRREFGEEESERFEDIRKETEERKAGEREAESERFANIEKERSERKAEELEFESEFFRLIREKRFEEADALQAEFIKKLKGGG